MIKELTKLQFLIIDTYEDAQPITIPICKVNNILYPESKGFSTAINIRTDKKINIILKHIDLLKSKIKKLKPCI